VDATVILFGTCHIYQWGTTDSEAVDRFQRRLVEIVVRYSAVCIAEEMSQDSLLQVGKQNSTVATLCAQRGLFHAYCDPPVSEQLALGIENQGHIHLRVQFGEMTLHEADTCVATQYRMREQYWLDLLLRLEKWPLVFVCGSHHVQFFGSLLAHSCINVVTEEKSWHHNDAA
jgi:hypothetical protein